jgi:membrane-anchored protein YejM (alkaline phosphatase superfamily)
MWAFSSVSDMKYRMAELMVPVVVTPLTDTTAATPSPTTYVELMMTLCHLQTIKNATSDFSHRKWSNDSG